jgi:hypothetical protein
MTSQVLVAHAIILAFQETEISRTEVRSQPRQIVDETLSQKYPTQKRAGGVSQVVQHVLSSNSLLLLVVLGLMLARQVLYHLSHSTSPQFLKTNIVSHVYVCENEKMYICMCMLFVYLI